MPLYLVKWNAGYGEDTEIIDASDIEDAQDYAYKQWREAVEWGASYSAQEATRELAKEEGLEEEFDDLMG